MGGGIGRARVSPAPLCPQNPGGRSGEGECPVPGWGLSIPPGAAPGSGGGRRARGRGTPGDAQSRGVSGGGGRVRGIWLRGALGPCSAWALGGAGATPQLQPRGSASSCLVLSKPREGARVLGKGWARWRIWDGASRVRSGAGAGGCGGTGVGMGTAGGWGAPGVAAGTLFQGDLSGAGTEPLLQESSEWKQEFYALIDVLWVWGPHLCPCSSGDGLAWSPQAARGQPEVAGFGFGQCQRKLGQGAAAGRGISSCRQV